MYLLRSQILRIYTDHKNLTGNVLNTDIVLRWRLIIENYGLHIEYIQGKNIYQQRNYQY